MLFRVVEKIEVFIILVDILELSYFSEMFLVEESCLL